MLNVEQLRADYDKIVKRVSKWTHVFEDDVIALITECESINLNAETDNEFIYINGKVDLDGTWTDFETSVEVVYA